MDNHILNISVKSFRGIKNLELKDTKLINILTGSNNSGKTSVLEIIRMLDEKERMKDSLCDVQFCYQPEYKNMDRILEGGVIYISSVRHAKGNVYLNKIWDYPDMYEQMLQVLKEYDEDIVSINYDNNQILFKSNTKVLPLNVYGDGMKKAVLLMSAVIAAKDGILLLDEFETAIHTSAMSKTFKWIVESCKRLNVQVFMTSHSKEAIDKLLKCSPDCLNEMAVYTLYKDAEGISVRRLEGKKAIEAQDEMGLELR